MAVSVIINVSVLSVGVILGSSVLSMMPQGVKDALNLLLPALFGALLVQFGMKQKSLAVTLLIIGILIYVAINAGLFNWLPGASNYLPTLACVFIGIGISLKMLGKKKEGQ